ASCVTHYHIFAAERRPHNPRETTRRARASRGWTRGLTEVGGRDARITQKGSTVALGRHFPHLEDVTVIRNLQRGPGVLFHQQDRYPARPQRCDNVEDFAYDERCEPQARLVKQEQLRLRHQRSTEREHPPFSAPQRSGELRRSLGKPRETLIDLAERPLNRPVPCAAALKGPER